MILDEATSAADPENQVEIDKAIENLCKGKTVIIVAHRLGAIKICDRVAVVENHTITCCGTHEEVRKSNAYYRKHGAIMNRRGQFHTNWKEVTHNGARKSPQEKQKFLLRRYLHRFRRAAFR